MQVKEVFVDLSPSQDKELRKYLATIIGNEISKVSSPCYFPKVIKYKQDVMTRANIKREQIKSFLKQFDKTYSKFGMFADEFTMTLIMLTLHYARNKDEDGAKLAYFLLLIKFYSSLVHISFPRFCNDDLWRLALTRISPKHLFREKNGIANAIVHLTTETYKRYAIKISSPNVTDIEIVRFVFEARGRLSQSIKSFAETYYALQKAGETRIGGSEEVSEKDGLPLIADKISMSICTYEQIDDDVLESAITKSGIRRDIANSIIEEISTVEYKDQVRFIIVLIGKISPIGLICKETGRLALIRKCENKKATVGNYVVRDEILNFLYSTEMGFRLKSSNSSQLVIFFLQYLTKYIQIKIC